MVYTQSKQDQSNDARHRWTRIPKENAEHKNKPLAPSFDEAGAFNLFLVSAFIPRANADP